MLHLALSPMPKVSVLDISDSNKIQEILDNDTSIITDRTAESDAESVDSNDSELGVVPRLLFSTFSTLMILVPLVSTHIALDMIVHQQYAQDLDVVEIAARAGTAAIGIVSFYLANDYSTIILDWGNSSTERSTIDPLCAVLCVSRAWCCNDSSEQGWRLLCCHGMTIEIVIDVRNGHLESERC
jgi:hypothetical protein